MEMINVIIPNDRILFVKNPFDENSQEYMCKGEYSFEKGNIYGIVSEYGEGGESISRLLSGEISLNEERILIDGKSIKNISDYGWYVGKRIISKGLVKRELTIRKSLNEAIHKYKYYGDISDIINRFHLSYDKIDYKFSNNSLWEMWRSSLALGYVSEKKIFCFPWMNSLNFYECMYNSGVFRLFKMLINEGNIIILPTSREENVQNLADKILKINNPRFQRVISKTEYFIDNF